MPRGTVPWLAASLLLGVILVGCDAVRPAPTRSDPSSTTAPASAKLRLADAARCPVTHGRAGPPDVPAEAFFGWSSSYGNGKLWVGGLWPDGVILAGRAFVEADGSIGMKFGWWRGVTGDLKVSGERLDAEGPPTRSSVPDGYGKSGFQASGINFPTEGCWEVTGEVSGTTLTFVTFVIKTEDLSLRRPAPVLRG
jgi:hypothetical protein